MTTLREAAEQALEALLDAQRHNYALKHTETDDLITALRAALAEPPRKTTCVYPQCVSTTRTTCDAWASGACDREA